MIMKQNLDARVFDQMKDRIINGEWQQGVNLDIESLVADFGVSRTPILQALKRMQNEGMLEVTRGGKFCFPRFNAEQVRNICRTRLVLELEAVEEIAPRWNELDQTNLRNLASWCRHRTDVGRVEDSRRFDMDWHKELVAASGNECLIGIYAKVQGQFMVANYLQAEHTMVQHKVAADDHYAFLAALDAGDIALAKTVLSGHITRAGDKIVAMLERSAAAETGEK